MDLTSLPDEIKLQILQNLNLTALGKVCQIGSEDTLRLLDDRSLGIRSQLTEERLFDDFLGEEVNLDALYLFVKKSNDQNILSFIYSYAARKGSKELVKVVEKRLVFTPTRFETLHGVLRAGNVHAAREILTPGIEYLWENRNNIYTRTVSYLPYYRYSSTPMERWIPYIPDRIFRAEFPLLVEYIMEEAIESRSRDIIRLLFETPFAGIEPEKQIEHFIIAAINVGSIEALAQLFEGDSSQFVFHDEVMFIDTMLDRCQRINEHIVVDEDEEDENQEDFEAFIRNVMDLARRKNPPHHSIDGVIVEFIEKYARVCHIDMLRYLRIEFPHIELEPLLETYLYNPWEDEPMVKKRNPYDHFVEVVHYLFETHPRQSKRDILLGLLKKLLTLSIQPRSNFASDIGYAFSNAKDECTPIEIFNTFLDVLLSLEDVYQEVFFYSNVEYINQTYDECGIDVFQIPRIIHLMRFYMELEFISSLFGILCSYVKFDLPFPMDEIIQDMPGFQPLSDEAKRIWSRFFDLHLKRLRSRDVEIPLSQETGWVEFWYSFSPSKDEIDLWLDLDKIQPFPYIYESMSYPFCARSNIHWIAMGLAIHWGSVEIVNKVSSGLSEEKISSFCDYFTRSRGVPLLNKNNKELFFQSYLRMWDLLEDSLTETSRSSHHLLEEIMKARIKYTLLRAMRKSEDLEKTLNEIGRIARHIRVLQDEKQIMFSPTDIIGTERDAYRIIGERPRLNEILQDPLIHEPRFQIQKAFLESIQTDLQNL